LRGILPEAGWGIKEFEEGFSPAVMRGARFAASRQKPPR